MKLLTCSAKNFGSYKDFEFNYENQGLTIITGENGSGKSTCLDVPYWVLTGDTPKGVGADGVRTWNEQEVTEGILSVEVENMGLPWILTIVRTRGKASQNDLYWLEDGAGEPIRGKNLPDTQKLLNQRLGIDPELYVTGSYIHEFSKADTFFISNAKDRREVLEALVDQSQAILLGDRASESRKQVKKDIEASKLELSNINGNLQSTKQYLQNSESSLIKWNLLKTKEKNELVIKYDNFENDRGSKLSVLLDKLKELSYNFAIAVDYDHEIDQVSKSVYILTSKVEFLEKERKKSMNLLKAGKCPTCNEIVDERHKTSDLEVLDHEIEVNKNALSEKEELLTNLKKELEFFEEFEANKKEYQRIESLTNNYKELLDKVQSEVNPYVEQIDDITDRLNELHYTYDKVESKIKDLENDLSVLNQLYDLSFELRGLLLNRAIQEIEASTNRYLEKYFDSEVKVAFELKEADKLEVLVQRNGNDCLFQQLSKGQRAFLQFAFRVSIMKAAANKAGVKFNCVFMDESLNGMSDNYKVKAFDLLQELSTEYETILVVDHSEVLKDCFSNKYEVKLIGDKSNINKL